MLPTGHFAGAYLAARAAAHFLPGLNDPKYLLAASLFGVFPDLDSFLVFAKAKAMKFNQDISHRNYPSHAPLLYLLIFLVGLLFPSVRLFAWAFLLGTWSHFLLDTFFFNEGIQWFYPFSSKRFSIDFGDRIVVSEDKKFLAFWIDFVKQYLKTKAVIAEFLIIAISIFAYFQKI